MEEKEVIQYLKDNMKKGISFHFTPKEVQDWIIKNYRDCAYLNDDGIWDRATSHVSDINDIWASDVYALIEGYEPKEHEKGWVELEIDRDGYFQRPGSSAAYKWPAWCDFLRLYSEFTAFGGWQYEDDGTWFTTPQLFAQECFTTLVDYDEICKPAIPKRIRFWREK